MLRHIPFYGTLLGREWPTGKASVRHVLLYGAIEAHSMGDKGCIASNKTLGEDVGLSPSRAASLVSELVTAGWIVVHLDKDNHRTLIEPTLTLTEIGKGPSQNRQPSIANPGNIEHSNRTQLDKNAEIDAQLDTLNSMFKRSKLRAYEKYRVKLKARLEHYTLKEIQDAAVAIMANEFMVNNGHNDLTYLLRNDENIQKWFEKPRTNQSARKFL